MIIIYFCAYKMNFVRITRCLLQPICERNALKRRLFTKETLDILSYENNRANALKNIENSGDFKSKLKSYLKNESQKSLTTLMKSVDILVHIISPTNDDYDLLEQTLIELTEFPEYQDNVKGHFGNHVMKALYSLNALDIIKEFYYHPKLRVFFKGFRCTLLYFDLAYKNENYKEIVEMDKIARRSIWAKGGDHFKFIDVIVIASCYKLNTIESYNYADYLWIEACESGHLKKTAQFMAAFAYKQRKWAQALHIANNNPGDEIIEQIKLLSLIELECYDELVECISSWSTHERFSKIKISKDVLDKIVQTVEGAASESSQNQFESMLIDMNRMIEHNQITVETIDDLLDRDITLRRKKSEN